MLTGGLLDIIFCPPLSLGAYVEDVPVTSYVVQSGI